jgi:hypothetical protein
MQNQSLVKYHTPILVSISQAKGAKKGATKKATPLPEKQTTQTEDILNSILPPRYLSVHINLFIFISWE